MANHQCNSLKTKSLSFKLPVATLARMEGFVSVHQQLLGYEACAKLVEEGRERAVKNRNLIAEKMTREKVAEAQRLVNK